MSLESLPSDILFNVFTLLDSLQDLHAVVSVNRSFYGGFWDHHAGVLQHVFHNQILKYCDERRKHPGPQSPQMYTLQYINLVVARHEKIESLERLVLRRTAWATFIGFKSPKWVFISLGNELISLCRTIGRNDLALSYAAELWKHISTRQTADHLVLQGMLATDKYANNFARDLAARYYHDLKSPEDAARTILQCYSMNLKYHDFNLFSCILKYTKEMADPSEVISFFQKRAAAERQSLITNTLKDNNLHWTFCYTLLLSDLGKPHDAILVFNNTYSLYTSNDLDPVTLESLSRRLIKSLKTQNHFDEAFTIHRQLLTLLSRMHRSNPSKYIAWGNQFISELYIAGRSDEALVVEEACWNRLRERLADGRDLSAVYTGRAAAWALYRGYERRGELEQARRVRSEYEELAGVRVKPGSRVVWPGEYRDDDFVRTGNGQRVDDRFLPFGVGSDGCTIQI